MRTGGAEALWSTVPPWLPVGLGSRQVPGKLGTQVSLRLGPQDVQRSLGRGGWEAAGAEDRHLRGRAGLSSEWDRGEAPLSERGRVWSGRGWEGAETSTPLSPAPRPRTHARTHTHTHTHSPKIRTKQNKKNCFLTFHMSGWCQTLLLDSQKSLLFLCKREVLSRRECFRTLIYLEMTQLFSTLSSLSLAQDRNSGNQNTWRNDCMFSSVQWLSRV